MSLSFMRSLVDLDTLVSLSMFRPGLVAKIGEVVAYGSLSGETVRKQIRGTVHTENARFEHRQWIIPTAVDLFTERGRRTVSLEGPGDSTTMGFLLPLPARPGIGQERWSEWLPKQMPSGQQWPSDKMSCRFRVQKVSLLKTRDSISTPDV